MHIATLQAKTALCVTLIIALPRPKGSIPTQKIGKGKPNWEKLSTLKYSKNTQTCMKTDKTDSSQNSGVQQKPVFR